MKYFFVSSFVIALSIQGCKKGTDTGQLPPNDSLTVHFATFGIESEGGNPNYWKNGTKIILPTTGNGGDVFAISASTKLAAGRVYQGLGWHRYSPCYWSGSNRTDLPLLDPRGNGWLTAIDYDGGDIFAAGNATDSLEFFGNSGWRNLPCYWHNGEITALELLNGFGNGMAYAVAKAATKPLDVHLMVENNTFFVDLFAPLKPKYISFHIEEEKHPHRLIQKIRSYGISPAITLNPHTSPLSIEYLLEDLDMVLLMSVNPGFGGQAFIPSVLEKSQRLKEMILKKNAKTLIEVDGGVNNHNIKALAQSGVDIVVAGNYVFGSDNYKNAIDSLK